MAYKATLPINIKDGVQLESEHAKNFGEKLFSYAKNVFPCNLLSGPFSWSLEVRFPVITFQLALITHVVVAWFTLDRDIYFIFGQIFPDDIFEYVDFCIGFIHVKIPGKGEMKIHMGNMSKFKVS